MGNPWHRFSYDKKVYCLWPDRLVPKGFSVFLIKKNLTSNLGLGVRSGYTSVVHWCSCTPVGRKELVTTDFFVTTRINNNHL